MFRSDLIACGIRGAALLFAPSSSLAVGHCAWVTGSSVVGLPYHRVAVASRTDSETCVELLPVSVVAGFGAVR